MADANAQNSAAASLERLDGLLQRVQNISSPADRDIATQLIGAVLEFHGAGICAMLDRLWQLDPMGKQLIDEFAQDAVIGSLLLLHGLHPLDLEARVRAALEKVRPYLASHGGNVELLEVSAEGTVRLRMQGSCHGCPSSAITLKTSIERAIYEGAPDVAGIEVEGVEDPPPLAPSGFVPLGQVMSHVSARPLEQGVPS